MPDFDYKTIEDLLLNDKKISKDQYDALKIQSINEGKSVKEILRDSNLVSQVDYCLAYSSIYGIEFISLRNKKIDLELFDIIPIELCKKYEAVPFNKLTEILQVAMTDPLNLEVMNFFEKKSGLKVVSYICTKQEIDDALEEAKAKTLGEDVTKAMEEITATSEALKLVESGILTKDDSVLKDAPVARIVGMILETAVKLGASDIHLEPSEEIIRLRYRVDGVLEERRTFPKEMSDSVVARIKVLSGLKIDEKRIPQDGRFKVEVKGVVTDLRVSTLPTVFGEKVVIRLLKAQSKVYSFTDLGMRGLTLRRFEEALLKPTGIILVTGPTGSGKTVTLATALNKLNTSKVNIVTVEDPVEIRVPGVNQVQVNVKAGLTFASALRSFLRQDPNIIMVGEIRDGETANLAIQAALTGHMVLSTLHTNSAAGAIPRLLDMQIENYLLSSTTNGILAQRLVRRLCTCKEEHSPTEDIKMMIQKAFEGVDPNHVLENKDKSIFENIQKIQSGEFKLYRPKGCDLCNNIGFLGRVGIYEFLLMTPEVSRQTLDRATSQEIENTAKSQGMVTLMQDGFLKSVEGLTSISEVLRVALS